jgi:hypothetical protein
MQNTKDMKHKIPKQKEKETQKKRPSKKSSNSVPTPAETNPAKRRAALTKQ